MTEEKSKITSEVLLDQAIDWVVRVKAAPEDPTLRLALEEWRAADIRHDQALRCADSAWMAVGEISPDRSKWPSVPTTDIKSTVPLRHPYCIVRQFVSLAAVACLLIVVWPSIHLHIQADYTTGTGETRVIALPDGSIVHLGAASAICTEYTDERRRIVLLSGQAFFEVATNSQRPFIASVDGMDVTVSGTAFDILLGERVYTVSVQSGTVAVRYEDGNDQQLVSGQQMTILRETGGASIERIAVNNVGAWREGRLFVHNRSIRDVVEILDRYFVGRIFIVDSALGMRRITGSYDLLSPDLALRGLVQPHRGQVMTLTPLLRVLRES